jgi:hypothetical protein
MKQEIWVKTALCYQAPLLSATSACSFVCFAEILLLTLRNYSCSCLKNSRFEVLSLTFLSTVAMADYFLFSLHRSCTWGRRRACRRIWYAHNFGDACVWTSKMWGRDDTFVAYMHAYLDASMAHINPLLSIACTEQTLGGAFRLIKIYTEDYMRMQLTGDCEACWSLHSFGIKRRSPRILHQSTRFSN